MHRRTAVLGAFTAGLLLGGTLSATVLWLASGLLSPVPQAWRYAGIVGAALLCVLRDAGAVRLALPQNARQIPQDVLRRGPLRGTFRFGLELGTGVRTYVTASAPYAVAAGVLLYGGGHGAGAALAAGIGFGLGRAATPALRLASGDTEEWDRRLAGRLRTVKVTASAAVAAALAALLLL